MYEILFLSVDVYQHCFIMKHWGYVCRINENCFCSLTTVWLSLLIIFKKRIWPPCKKRKYLFILLLVHSSFRLVGGKGESHANIAEGLATALQCFEDLQQRREPNLLPQKHCILVCNSPPYLLPVMESPTFAGHSVEQLAVLLQEVR